MGVAWANLFAPIGQFKGKLAIALAGLASLGPLFPDARTLDRCSVLRYPALLTRATIPCLKMEQHRGSCRVGPSEGSEDRFRSGMR